MLRSLVRAPLGVSLPLVATGALAADPALTDDASKTSYSLGYQLGRDMPGVDMRNDALLKGLQDGRSGTKPALTAEEMGALLASLQQKVNEQRQKNQQAELAKTDYNGVTGRVQFDAKGDLAGGNVTLYKVSGGKWMPLETVKSGK